MRKTTLTLTAAALSAACLAPAQAGVLAHYSFDTDFTDGAALTGGGTLSEVENGGATVSIINTAGDFVFGGGAADFDSTTSNEAYLNLAEPINFADASAWSVAFWVRRDSGSDVRQGMVAGDPSNSTSFLWRTDNATQVQGLRYRSTTNNNSNFDIGPDQSEWEHWAVVSNGDGTIDAYLNNVAQPQLAGDEVFDITAIGQAYSANTFSMNGQLDEMYIFDEAIDSGTVSSLFNSNVVPTPSTFALASLGFVAMLGRRRRRG